MMNSVYNDDRVQANQTFLFKWSLTFAWENLDMMVSTTQGNGEKSTMKTAKRIFRSEFYLRLISMYHRLVYTLVY